MSNIDKLLKLEYNEPWKIEYAKIKYFTEYPEPFSAFEVVMIEDKANKLKKANMRKLYKYYSLEDKYSVDNVINSVVHMNNPNKVNDPFDSMFSFLVDNDALLKDVLCQLKEINSEYYQKIIEKDKDEVLNEVSKTVSNSIIKACDSIRNNTWITCFSEVYDSILMWSHYANYHKGFCVEYTFSESYSAFNDLSPVLYIDKIYYIDDETTRANGKMMELCSLLKCSDWLYEKEWRLVVSNLVNAKAEFMKVPMPTAIYYGACSEGNKQLSEFAEKNGIKVHKLRMSTKEYKIIV